MKPQRIAVLGAGAGGQATAAHLKSCGYDVVLYEQTGFRENADAIAQQGHICLQGALELEAEVEVRVLSGPDVLRDEELLILVVPSFAQEPFFEHILPGLEARHTLLIVNGNFGSLVLRQYAERFSKQLECLVGETDSLVYGCIVQQPGVVRVTGIKSALSISALPKERTQELIDVVQGCIPSALLPANNVLEIGLSNQNMILHCATMLLNVARIETPGQRFSFYSDGVTPSVARIMGEMDRERVLVCTRLGLVASSTLEWLRRTYGVQADSLFQAVVSNPAYRAGPLAPQSFQHRFVTEDVPDLLVPVVSLGELADVDATTIRAIIALTSIVSGVDYFAVGRTADRMGFRGLSVSEILASL